MLEKIAPLLDRRLVRKFILMPILLRFRLSLLEGRAKGKFHFLSQMSADAVESKPEDGEGIVGWDRQTASREGLEVLS